MSAVDVWNELRQRLADERVSGTDHVWVVMMTHGLAPNEAAEVHAQITAGVRTKEVTFGPPVDVSPVACILCELEYPAAVPCPGIPVGYQLDGRPIHGAIA